MLRGAREEKKKKAGVNLDQFLIRVTVRKPCQHKGNAAHGEGKGKLLLSVGFSRGSQAALHKGTLLCPLGCSE